MPTAQPRVLVVVLAGGEGARLMPLTAERAKPAVPFGGIYRLIDFALSNVMNSGYRQVLVLTQYKSHSLDVHISRTWPAAPMLGSYVAAVPAQQRVGKHWYAGSADAIYQSLNAIEDARPDLVVVISADHVYRMDFSQMVAAHLDSGLAMTVAALRRPAEQSARFGVIAVDPAQNHRITHFVEKPAEAGELADEQGQILASMGNYVFTTQGLIDALRADHEDSNSNHDVGADLVPRIVAEQGGQVYHVETNGVPGASPRDHGYWRDVGTLDAYFEAHQDLVSVVPIFNLYNELWPIHTNYGALPPAKFVHDDGARSGVAVDSVVSPGVIVSGAQVRRSVIGPQAHLHSFAQVSDSVVMDRVRIGAHAQVRRAIIDKQVDIPANTTIGVNHELDRARGFVVTDAGVTVIAKGQVVLPDAQVDLSRPKR